MLPPGRPHPLHPKGRAFWGRRNLGCVSQTGRAGASPCVPISLRRNSKQILAEFVFIFVKKIDKNPKIRIKIIYCSFDFFQKLFWCGFLFFWCFFVFKKILFRRKSMVFSFFSYFAFFSKIILSGIYIFLLTFLLQKKSVFNAKK